MFSGTAVLSRRGVYSYLLLAAGNTLSTLLAHCTYIIDVVGGWLDGWDVLPFDGTVASLGRVARTPNTTYRSHSIANRQQCTKEGDHRHRHRHPPPPALALLSQCAGHRSVVVHASIGVPSIRQLNFDALHHQVKHAQSRGEDAAQV